MNRPSGKILKLYERRTKGKQKGVLVGGESDASQKRETWQQESGKESTRG